MYLFICVTTSVHMAAKELRERLWWSDESKV